MLNPSLKRFTAAAACLTVVPSRCGGAGGII